MAQPNQLTKVNIGFFHALSKTRTEANQYVFEAMYKSAHSVLSRDIWTDTVPFAETIDQANINTINFPEIIKKYEKFQLSPIPGSNNQAWYINDEKFVKPWIAPTDIAHQSSGAASNGYQANLYKENESLITPTEGVWLIDYYAGIVLFEPGSTPIDLGYGNPKITCYTYIGNTLDNNYIPPMENGNGQYFITYTSKKSNGQYLSFTGENYTNILNNFNFPINSEINMIYIKSSSGNDRPISIRKNGTEIYQANLSDGNYIIDNINLNFNQNDLLTVFVPNILNSPLENIQASFGINSKIQQELGATGSFTSKDDKLITVENGLITSII